MEGGVIPEAWPAALDQAFWTKYELKAEPNSTMAKAADLSASGLVGELQGPTMITDPAQWPKKFSEAPSLADVTDPTARLFRSFADQTRSDLRALAACLRGSRQTLSRAEVARIAVPLLVAVGSKDLIAGSPQELAALIPGARALEIPNRDHMLAVGDKVFKAGVLEFLNQRP